MLLLFVFPKRGFMPLSFQQRGPLHIMGLTVRRMQTGCLRFAIYDSRMIIENKDELYQDIIWNELRQFSCHRSLVLWLIFRMLRGRILASPVLFGTSSLQSIKGDTERSRVLSFKSGIHLKLELKIKNQSVCCLALSPTYHQFTLSTSLPAGLRGGHRL